MTDSSPETRPFIGTHDSTFHCDDVTACFMLKALDRFKDHDIVRTRDPALLDQADVVVDVGGVLDVETLRFDHHQRSFDQTIHDYHPDIKTTDPDYPPRLSSAGLVYAIFGKDLIVTTLGLGTAYEDIDGDEEKERMVNAIYDKSYTQFIEEIDAIDNGVEQAEYVRYYIKTGLSSRVGRLNPTESGVSDEERMEKFKVAMDMVGREITECIQYLGNSWWPKRQLFRKCVEERTEFDPSGAVVFLGEEYFAGWKSSVHDLEVELGIEEEIKYVVYKEKSQWRVTGVPTEQYSFTTRVPLKEEWRGKRDEELQSVSGVPDATFVHMSGFTGGARSREGIIAMIHKSLESSESQPE